MSKIIRVILPKKAKSLRKIIGMGILLMYFTQAAGQTNFSIRDFPVGFDSSHVTFLEECNFYKDRSKNPSHWRSQFYSDASFKNDSFRRRVDCREVHFSNDIYFNHSTFNETADFTNDTFNSDAVFESAIFLSECHFINANFQNTANFTKTIFTRTAYFTNLTLTDTTELIFDKAVLPDTIDFSNISPIPREINLSKAFEDSTFQGHKHYIYLEGSDISKFRLDYKYFRLLFNDPKNVNLEMAGDQKDAIYENLLKNFKDRGQLESYELLDIEFNDYQWSKKAIPIRWLYVLPHYWNAYGHENGRVFLWAGLFLLLFTCITFRHLEHLSTDVYVMSNIKDYKSLEEIRMIRVRRQRIHEYLERFWNSLIYTSTIFFLFSLNMNRFRFRYKRAAFYLLTVYTVGIICIAYMANFVISR